jgi:hypothetical protein
MKLFVENNVDKYPIILGADTDSTPTGYLDDTSIVGIATNRHLEDIMDYEHIRDWILEEMMKNDPDYSTAFSMCSLQEQKWIARFQLMPYAVRMTLISDEEDAEYWEKLVILSEGTPLPLMRGRNLVYQKLRVCVSNFVRKEVWAAGDYFANLTHAQNFGRDIRTLKDDFIANNDPYFGQFLKSTGDYELNGFKSKSYWLQELEDELLEIYNSY